MAVSEMRKKRYLSCVYVELRRRGLWDEDIPFVIREFLIIREK